RYRLLRLIEHRRELEVRRKLAVHRADGVAESATLERIGWKRPREPGDDRGGDGHNSPDQVRHHLIVPRPGCIHPGHLLDTSDVSSGTVLRSRERTLATPYFPVGGPVPAAALVGRWSSRRRLVASLE